MKELHLKQIQQACLATFLKLDEICRKLNIHYYMAFGTLIGVVRHKGFIPWDDDIDVMMLRKDYETLREYMETHENELKPFRICARKNTKNYSPSIPRFVDTSYIFESSYPYEKKFELGAFVDIYILDYCGNSFAHGKTFGKQIRKWDKRYMIYLNPDNGKRNIKYFIRCILCALLHLKWGKNYDFDARMQKYNAKIHSENDEYVGVLYDCDPMKKTWFENPPEADFEGHKVFIPHNYDEVLNLTHKGYMQLPPESERSPHHNYKMYMPDKQPATTPC